MEETTLVEKLEENEAVAKSMLSNWLDKWQEAHDIMRVSICFLYNVYLIYYYFVWY